MELLFEADNSEALLLAEPDNDQKFELMKNNDFPPHWKTFSCIGKWDKHLGMYFFHGTK